MLFSLIVPSTRSSFFYPDLIVLNSPLWYALLVALFCYEFTLGNMVNYIDETTDFRAPINQLSNVEPRTDSLQHPWSFPSD